jgi:hypothetical protein
VFAAAATGAAFGTGSGSGVAAGAGSKPSTAGTATTAQAPAKPAAPKPAAPGKVEDLKERTDLRGPFNLGAGKVRVLAFLSPTCMHCIENSGQLHEALKSMPGEDIDVHIVWLQILDTDDRAMAVRNTQALTDRRIHHYWDPKRLLNHQLLDAIQFDIQLRLYDFFLLYDRKATWEQRLPKPGYWMHEYKGAPGPTWDAKTFAVQIGKALRGEPLDTIQQ